MIFVWHLFSFEERELMSNLPSVIIALIHYFKNSRDDCDDYAQNIWSFLDMPFSPLDPDRGKWDMDQRRCIFILIYKINRFIILCHDLKNASKDEEYYHIHEKIDDSFDGLEMGDQTSVLQPIINEFNGVGIILNVLYQDFCPVTGRYLSMGIKSNILHQIYDAMIVKDMTFD